MRAVLGVVLAFVAVGCGRIDFATMGNASGDASGDASGSGASTSCAALPPTCGPGRTSCCDSPLVPGGTFYRNNDMANDGNYTNTTESATVSSFLLDRYELTVGRFRAFVLAGQGTQAAPPAPIAGAHPGLANSGWDPAWNANLVTDTSALIAGLNCNAMYQTWTDAPGTKENRAINCLTWYEAMAFCAWDGGFLPTEAEWHYAASAGGEQRAYPWSSPAGDLTIDCSHTNYNPGAGSCAMGVDDVGARSPTGDGVWQHSDLAGNVFEWTLDYSGAYPIPCDDCANLMPAATRAIRGGSYGDSILILRSAYRTGYDPTTRHTEVGVRCARSPG
jgi:formylglycine-generating enzyme required for sulfatase activity